LLVRISAEIVFKSAHSTTRRSIKERRSIGTGGEPISQGSDGFPRKQSIPKGMLGSSYSNRGSKVWLGMDDGCGATGKIELENH